MIYLKVSHHNHYKNILNDSSKDLQTGFMVSKKNKKASLQINS